MNNKIKSLIAILACSLLAGPLVACAYVGDSQPHQTSSEIVETTSSAVTEGSTTASTTTAAPTTSALTTEPTTTAPLTRDDYFNLIYDLPASFDPYITEVTPEAELIFNELKDEFSETNHKQALRHPATMEFFVRGLMEDPGATAVDPGYDPFPDYDFQYYSQWDQRWGYTDYIGGYFGLTGCGPTAMAMVYASLTGDTSYGPYEMGQFALENGYAAPEFGTGWVMMNEGASKLGLTVKEIGLDPSLMINELNAGRPIILSIRAGEHFTTVGHYIVLVEAIDGQFVVFDPFDVNNTHTLWDFEDMSPQIRNIWSYDY